MIILSPILRSDKSALSRLRASLLGGRLESVSYHYFPADDDSPYETQHAFIHDGVIAAVLEIMGRGRVVITWAMTGELEGLTVLDIDEPYPGVANRIADVSEIDGWDDHIGKVIMSLAAAWHVSDDDCPESLWALRFDFTTGSVVVALGTLNGDVAYMPDELVVIFDSASACLYRSTHGSPSAWGEPFNDV